MRSSHTWTTWIEGTSKNPDVQRIAASIYEAGGVVAAVCHGPAALVDVNLPSGQYLVAGRQVAAFSDAEEEAAGLTWVMPFLLQSTLVSMERPAPIAAS